MIDTLLRLKVDDDDNNSNEQKTINLIGSYQDSIPGIKIGKSASALGVQSNTAVGEPTLREFIGLLKSYIH